MTNAIILENVSKRFDEVWAVRGLSLTIRGGSIFGLLGPNGSGKSTTMRMMLGLVKPDSGRVSVHGIDPAQNPVGVKRIIGYVPETPRLYEYLTAAEYLDFIREAYGVAPSVWRSRVAEFLEAFGLSGREGELLAGYSRGMKQKIALMAAFLHRPRVLILDEPLSGLDPKSARLVKEMLHKLALDGTTTIISTHVLEIAEAICDRIAILYEGEKIAEGSPEELKLLSESPSSTLEDVFLKLTGSEDIRELVEALVR